MRLEVKKIKDLRVDPTHPKKELKTGDAAYERLRRSILTLGYNAAIVVGEDGVIIDGNQRFKILSELGYTEIEVLVVDIEDEEKRKALQVALNKIHGEFDNEKLYAVLAAFEEKDLQELIAASGFDRDEYEELKSILIPTEAHDDDFDTEAAYNAAVANPTTKRGDIWLLGEHRLMCGDSTVQADVDRLMAGEQADLIVTDPPYNVNYGEKVKDMTEALRSCTLQRNSDIKNDNLSDAAFRQFMAAAYNAIYNVTRPGGVIYVFHADTQGIVFREEFVGAGFKLSQCLIWEKNTFVLGRQDYQWRHEPVLYGWKEGAPHYFIDDRCQDTILLQEDTNLESKSKKELIAAIEQVLKYFSDKQSVIYDNKPQRSEIHPTMKPVSLYGRLINNSSKVGDVVLDTFCGSGTLIIAAEQLHRKARAMEADEAFCDAIIKRWEELTGEKAIKLDV